MLMLNVIQMFSQLVTGWFPRPHSALYTQVSLSKDTIHVYLCNIC